MPPTALFQDLPATVSRHLSRARQHVQIAVCWFSHRDIFDVLLERLRAGVRVELLLEYDTQNIRKQGLDFQKFIQLGGSLYAYRDTALMHHKFALIDNALLLTGSYNWTYSSNAENLLVADDSGLITAFRDEFNRLKALSIQVRKIRPADVKVFANYALFENTRFHLIDLRRRIGGGARMLWVRMHKLAGTAYLREHRLPFDAEGLLKPYWTAFRHWDEDLFDEIWPELSASAKPATARSVRQLARRMHTGDVVLALTDRRQVVGLGVVQSNPKPAADGGDWSSYRDVQWLRELTDAPLVLPAPVSSGAAGRFRGSGLQVVQAFFPPE